MKPSKLSHVGILCLNIFIVAYWYAGFDGFYFYDDLTYAKNALQIVNGTFSFADHLFSQRLTIIGATAVSYFFFGISDYATILPPLICTLITCNAIYFFLLKKSFFVAIMAASVYTLDFYTIFFSNKLYPDVLLCCFVFLGLVILYSARTSHEKIALKALGVVFFLFLAFLAKLTILFVFPFLLGLFINDLIKRQNVGFWYRVIILSMGVGSIYLWWEYQTFGNCFYRFNAIVSEGHYVSNGSYFDKNWFVLIKRITFQPVIMLLNSSMIIPLGLAFPVLIGYRAGKLWNHNSFEKFWAYAALSMLIYFWWGSTSWQYYNPIALFQRHLLLAVPPLAILSGLSLQRINEFSWVYTLIFAVITLLGIWQGVGPVLIVYSSLFGGFAVYRGLQFMDQAAINKIPTKKNMLAALLILILAVHPVYSMLKPSESGYANLTEMVNAIEKEENNILLITDRQIASNCEYVFRDWKEQPDCMTYASIQNIDSLAEFEKAYILKYDFHLPLYRKSYLNLIQKLEENGLKMQSLHEKGNTHLFEICPDAKQMAED